MSLTPKTFRRPGFPKEGMSRLRYSLEKYLNRVDPAKSALIIDGLVPGLASHFVVLSLLGPERVSRFQSIHSLCTGSNGVLFFLAWQKDMLSLTSEKIVNFNRAFQAGHNISGWGQGSRLFLRMLIGATYMVNNDSPGCSRSVATVRLRTGR